MMWMTGIDYNAWRFWWDIGMTVLMAGNLVYTFFMNRSKAASTAINHVDERVTVLADRVGRLESDVRHLPDHGDLGAIHEKVNRVASGMEGMRGELVAINRTLGLINEHLLNHGGRQ